MCQQDPLFFGRMFFQDIIPEFVDLTDRRSELIVYTVASWLADLAADAAYEKAFHLDLTVFVQEYQVFDLFFMLAKCGIDFRILTVPGNGIDRDAQLFFAGIELLEIPVRLVSFGELPQFLRIRMLIDG